MPAVITDSIVTIRRTCQRLMPTARSMPSSRVRSCTESASVLTMPEQRHDHRQRQQREHEAEQLVDGLRPACP